MYKDTEQFHFKRLAGDLVYNTQAENWTTKEYEQKISIPTLHFHKVKHHLTEILTLKRYGIIMSGSNFKVYELLILTNHRYSYQL